VLIQIGAQTPTVAEENVPNPIACSFVEFFATTKITQDFGQLSRKKSPVKTSVIPGD
jgi:hypothetical protein